MEEVARLLGAESAGSRLVLPLYTALLNAGREEMNHTRRMSEGHGAGGGMLSPYSGR